MLYHASKRIFLVHHEHKNIIANQRLVSLITKLRKHARARIYTADTLKNTRTSFLQNSNHGHKPRTTDHIHPRIRCSTCKPCDAIYKNRHRRHTRGSQTHDHPGTHHRHVHERNDHYDFCKTSLVTSTDFLHPVSMWVPTWDPDVMWLLSAVVGVDMFSQKWCSSPWESQASTMWFFLRLSSVESMADFYVEQLQARVSGDLSFLYGLQCVVGSVLQQHPSQLRVDLNTRHIDSVTCTKKMATKLELDLL